MKTNFPIYNLQNAAAGISINKLNDGYVCDKMNTIAEFHRNDFYMFFLLNKGTASFFIDFQQLDVTENSMLFLYPGQIQKIIDVQESDGWVLFFDHKLMDDQSREILEESVYESASIAISVGQKEWFNGILELLYKTADSSEMAAFQKPAMVSLLTACVFRIAAIHQQSTQSDMTGYSSRTITIIRNFRKLVRENHQSMKRPKQYANLMNLSPGYLNDTVKMVTGFSVSDIIRKQSLKEAQRLLYHSDLSIKEIAAAIGFEDPKYFSRFFSKSVKTAPMAFRKSYRLENESPPESTG